MPANLASMLNNLVPEQTVAGTVLNGKLELAAYAPIYDTDSLVRRAESLRKTKAAKPAKEPKVKVVAAPAPIVHVTPIIPGYTPVVHKKNSRAAKMAARRSAPRSA